MLRLLKYTLFFKTRMKYINEVIRLPPIYLQKAPNPHNCKACAT